MFFKTKSEKIRESNLIYLFAKNFQCKENNEQLSEEDIKNTLKNCFEKDIIPQKNFYYANAILRDNIDTSNKIDSAKTKFYQLLLEKLKATKYFSHDISPREKKKMYEEALKSIDTSEASETNTSEVSETNDSNDSEEPFVKTLGEIITKLSGVKKNEISEILKDENISFEEDSLTFRKGDVQYGISFSKDVVKHLVVNGKTNSVKTMKDCDILSILPAAEGSKVKSGKNNNNGYAYLHGDDTVISIGLNPDNAEIFVDVEYNAPRDTRRKFTTSNSKKK